jgi:hypothetical protein
MHFLPVATLALPIQKRRPLKGNQPTLHDRVADYFEEQLEKDKPDAQVRCTKGEERGHGRQEKREVWVAPIPEHWRAAEEWRDVKSIAMVCTEQTSAHSGETQGDVRFYISSLAPKARLHRRVIRSHWGIENGWTTPRRHSAPSLLSRRHKGG